MSRPRRAPGTLSPREREICELVADGLANKQIAQRLALATSTVKTILMHAMAVLGVDCRVLVARWVYEQRYRPRWDGS